MMLYVLSVVALIASPVLSYSAGAPTAVCDSLAPNHGGLLSQETPAPYKLELSSTTANSGAPISITLKGNGNDDVIKGFIIQARVNGKPAGSFTPGANSQTIDCSGAGDTLTHKKILTQVNKIEAQWTPTGVAKGSEVQLVATVVQRGDIFWVQKLSQKLSVA